MRQVLLLRHGEAEPAMPGQDDAQRSLTRRGREQVHAAAQLLQARSLQAPLILCSTARRAVQSASLLVDQLLWPAPQLDPALYLASTATLLATLRGCDERAHAVLVVGHNPGLSELAHQLTGHEPAIELTTAGLCRLGIDASWSRLTARAVREFELLR